MEFDDLLETQNVDDIIAQYDNDDGDEDITGDISFDVDDLLKDDLVASTLLSPATTTTNNTMQQKNDNNNGFKSSPNSRPQLTSTLPPPMAPKTDDINKSPDLPSTISRYSIPSTISPSNNNNDTLSPQSTTEQEQELDIETILNDSKMDDDLLGSTIDDDNDGNDPLLEFDPYGIGIVCNDDMFCPYSLSLHSVNKIIRKI